MKFIFVEKGVHVGKDGQRHTEGAIIESSVDLTVSFPGRFKKIDSVSPVSSKQMAPAMLTVTRAGDPPPPSPRPREIKKIDFGAEVTHQFPKAEDAGLKVFRKGGVHTVVDADEPNLPLHDKGMKKVAVGPFIDSYLEG